ncbi:hypothetical protein Hanom_Chr05g00386631 [Helianthus anomalus]
MWMRFTIRSIHSPNRLGLLLVCVSTLNLHLSLESRLVEIEVDFGMVVVAYQEVGLVVVFADSRSVDFLEDLLLKPVLFLLKLNEELNSV